MERNKRHSKNKRDVRIEDEDDSIVQDHIIPQESAYIDTRRKSLKNTKQVRLLLLLFWWICFANGLLTFYQFHLF